VNDALELEAELGPHGVKELLDLLRTTKRPGVATVEFHLGVGRSVDLEIQTNRKVLDPRRSGR
jgi:hypothetical protein